LERYDFVVFADFHQFLFIDAAADWSDLWTKWDGAALDRMVASGTGYVAVATARDMHVPVTLVIAPADPGVPHEAWDREVASEIEISSGTALLRGITRDGSGGSVSMVRGRYSVRVLFSGLDKISIDGLTGEDRYMLQAWPMATRDAH
jgi:hypothetical protein